MLVQKWHFMESQDWWEHLGFLAFWLGNLGIGVPENEMARLTLVIVNFQREFNCEDFNED